MTIADERRELENAVADAFIALRHADVYLRYIEAEHRLAEHRMVYGTGDLTIEPVGLLPDAGYALPDEFPFDLNDTDHDFRDGDVIT
jgi:hypothetical protein